MVATAGAGGGEISVVVPDYPFFDGTTMEQDEALLDELAERYANRQGANDLVMTRLLFSDVPVTLFDRVFATANPADELPMGAYGNLAEAIPPLQSAGIERGRMVWDGLLNVQGFSQEAYEHLLDISSAFLETVQATALGTVQAAAERNVGMGRKAATSNALLKLWLASYLVGISDGRPGRTLPEFVTA